MPFPNGLLPGSWRLTGAKSEQEEDEWEGGSEIAGGDAFQSGPWISNFRCTGTDGMHPTDFVCWRLRLVFMRVLLGAVFWAAGGTEAAGLAAYLVVGAEDIAEHGAVDDVCSWLCVLRGQLLSHAGR